MNIQELEEEIKKAEEISKKYRREAFDIDTEIYKLHQKAKAKRLLAKSELNKIPAFKKKIATNVYKDDEFQKGFTIEIPKAQIHPRHYYSNREYLYSSVIDTPVKRGTTVTILKRTKKMINCKITLGSMGRWGHRATDSFEEIERRFAFRTFSNFIKEIKGYEEYKGDMKSTKRTESIESIE